MSTAANETAHAAPSQLLFLSSRPPGQIRWTEEQVLRRIYERQRAGLPLNRADVQREAPCLLGAAHRKFGSWATALKAAGVIQTAIIRPNVVYTRESIISRLREHSAAGLPLSSNHPRLRNGKKAVRRLFGSWAAAFEAAGVVPDRQAVSKQSREQLLEAFRRRARAGLSIAISHPEMQKYISPARRLFGSWNKAREAAGYPHGRQLDEEETLAARERFLEMLRNRARSGLSIATTDPEMMTYHEDARRLFGSWTQAREAAGCPRPSPSDKDAVAEREKILEVFRDRARAGLSVAITHPDMRKYIRPVRRLIGSWSKARKEAGCANHFIAVRPDRTPEKLLDLLRERRLAGLTLSSTDRELQRWWHCAKEHFGSWTRARILAGDTETKPDDLRKQILEVFRERTRKGLSTASTHPDMQKYISPVRRLFGSWTKVRETGGYTCRHQINAGETLAARERILEMLRGRTSSGLSVATTDPEMMTYIEDARRLFGSWTQAREAAGCPRLPSGGKNAVTEREKILEIFRDRARSGLPVVMTHPDMQKYIGPVRRLIGSWSKAREVAGCANPHIAARANRTPEGLLDLLRERRRAGLSQSCNLPDLYPWRRCAKEHFGSWKRACKAARCPTRRKRGS